MKPVTKKGMTQALWEQFECFASFAVTGVAEARVKNLCANIAEQAEIFRLNRTNRDCLRDCLRELARDAVTLDAILAEQFRAEQAAPRPADARPETDAEAEDRVRPQSFSPIITTFLVYAADLTVGRPPVNRVGDFTDRIEDAVRNRDRAELTRVLLKLYRSRRTVRSVIRSMVTLGLM